MSWADVDINISFVLQTLDASLEISCTKPAVCSGKRNPVSQHEIVCLSTYGYLPVRGFANPETVLYIWFSAAKGHSPSLSSFEVEIWQHVFEAASWYIGKAGESSQRSLRFCVKVPIVIADMLKGLLDARDSEYLHLGSFQRPSPGCRKRRTITDFLMKTLRS